MKRPYIFIPLIFFIIFGFPLISSAQHDYIEISNPYLRKIPIAIPAARISPASAAEYSDKTAEMLSKYLNFTGYFKILDPRTFLMDRSHPPVDLPDINFPAWNNIGTELLVTTYALVQNDLIEAEFRLFDTVKGQLLIGKKYKGWTKDLKKIVLRFCSEIIHHLTGDWGIFESRIAFISSGSGSKELWFCDFDGSNPRQITRSGSITLTPAWSSDGKWIAYTSYEKGRPDLYIRHPGQKRGAVVSKKGINTTPAWVPGKFMLAATLSFSGDQDIYLLSGNGKMMKKLIGKWGIDTSPTWSPDGSEMAFVSDRSGSPQIYIRHIASGKTRRLTFEGRYNTQPAWSPKGDKIAYSSIERGEINIHITDLKTQAPIRLTYSSGKNESPSWSPDGSLIVFSSDREGAGRLYVMTAAGTDQRRLLSLPGEQSSPAWSSRIQEN
ncbi:MAG: Tol-Pal system beta propeller repeat protein TolB [Desulfococcaceae bacterium]|jgi:TolB protein|nr:Tol-Pal system beta propeller repeat protein TolB [Desulfococcaceae bacterium]